MALSSFFSKVSSFFLKSARASSQSGPSFETISFLPFPPFQGFSLPFLVFRFNRSCVTWMSLVINLLNSTEQAVIVKCILVSKLILFVHLSFVSGELFSCEKPYPHILEYRVRLFLLPQDGVRKLDSPLSKLQLLLLFSLTSTATSATFFFCSLSLLLPLS